MLKKRLKTDVMDYYGIQTMVESRIKNPKKFKMEFNIIYIKE
tara:strand:+ start:15137 stop:15262 length:126 start_codon:yes stop_codon:yes gene_type:complete